MAEQQNQPETKPYRLKAGMRHFHQGTFVGAGSVVELTKEQAAAFADKFESTDRGGFENDFRPNEGPGVEKGVRPEDHKVEQPSQRAVPTSHSPQDVGAKTPTPGVPDQNPGNEIDHRNRGPVAQMQPDSMANGPHQPAPTAPSGTVQGGAGGRPALEPATQGKTVGQTQASGQAQHPSQPPVKPVQASSPSTPSPSPSGIPANPPTPATPATPSGQPAPAPPQAPAKS